MKQFYITTAIPYANSIPHVGHVFELIGTDVVARAKRMLGYDVYFQTGTDEHGQKMLDYATRAGKSPLEYADEIAPRFQDLWRDMHISHDNFIRSTMPKHQEGVAKFWRTVRDNGDIYLSKYEGWYCVAEENFILESQINEMPDGRKLCPDCGAELTWKSEESYFFRWSKYQDAVATWIADHPDFIQPAFRANEMVNTFLKPGLQDLSISRSSIKWGVPVPDDPNHVVYVWFDALINYITGIGYATQDERFHKWWPADLHIVGKDILKFHALLWPAMCMAAGIEIPRRIFSHGFISPRPKTDSPNPQLNEGIYYDLRNVDTETGHEGVLVDVYDKGEHLGTVSCPGFTADKIIHAIIDQFGGRVAKLEKMSKSKGNVVNPRDLLALFDNNPDPLRFFLMRETDFGQDGLFSEEALLARYNSDLANKLGNLLSRTLAMVEKYQNGLIEIPGAYTEEDDAVRDSIMSLFQRAQLPAESVVIDPAGTTTLYEQLIDECRFNFLLERIWASVQKLNIYITDTKPFSLAKDLAQKDRLRAILYILCEGLRVIATMICPFMPSTAEQIWARLGCATPLPQIPFERLRHWGYLHETRVTKGDSLFPFIQS